MTKPAANPFLSETFQRALELAAVAHRDQPRKGTEVPYIVHPVSVAWLVRECGGSEVAEAAALVHDVSEDAGVPIERIRRELGDRVAAIVETLTEDKGLPWVMRKRAGIAKYRAADEETRLVAAMDKLAALIGFAGEPRAGDDAFWERFNAGRALQAWYYHALSDAFASSSFGTEFRRLTDEVFGPDPPVGNPCGLYVEYALRHRGEAAWKRRLEARTLWLNATGADQAAMASVLDTLLDDADLATAARAAEFLGFAGRAWPGADARLVRTLETDSRIPVVAAALVAVRGILANAMEGDSTAAGLSQACESLRRDAARREAVAVHLERLVEHGGSDDLLQAARWLRAATGGR